MTIVILRSGALSCIGRAGERRRSRCLGNATGGAMQNDPADPAPPAAVSIVESPSAAARLEAALEFVAGYPAGTEMLVVAPSRQAADDFVRDFAGSIS